MKTFRFLLIACTSVLFLWSAPASAQRIYSLTLHQAQRTMGWIGSDEVQSSMAKFTIASLQFLKTETKTHPMADVNRFLDTQSYYHKLFMEKYYDKVLKNRRKMTAKLLERQKKFIQATWESPLFSQYSGKAKYIAEDHDPLFAFNLNTDWKKAYELVD